MPLYPRLCKTLYKICSEASKVMTKHTKSAPISSRNKSDIGEKGVSGKTKNNKKFEVLPTPVKSEYDKKEYKVIRLANGLTACLISDIKPDKDSQNAEESDCSEVSSEEGSMSEESESENEESDASMDDAEDPDDDLASSKQKQHRPDQKLAAAALCIGVGSFSDPKDIPGLAHFLEHMVFMGSAKYPKENAFDEFMKRNGGNDNASTDTETTVFYYECLERYLEEGLDMFSQFFINPLMKREAMTRERESIESEFQGSLNSDGSRKEQLLCSLSQKDSPVNNFAWGNLKTLRDNISDQELYKRVHEFRKRHYSAHRMTLAIRGRMTMEDLEQMVINSFSAVPNNGLPAEDFAKTWTSPFDTPEFNKIYYVKPSKELCQLEVTWALPSLLGKYRTKPQYFLSHLLGDEGKGSLLSYLKKKLWVLGTNSGHEDTGSEHNSMYTLFSATFNLTDEGFRHVEEIIEVLFAYLKMVKEQGPSRRIFDELQAVAKMSFKYAENMNAVDQVEELCEAMQHFPAEDLLSGPTLYFEFDPDSINMLLDLMTADKANIMILNSNLEKETQDIKYDKVEKWFGTQYTSRTIPDEWMETWGNPRLIPDLSIPPENSFITQDFTLLPLPPQNPDYPQLIHKTPLLEIYYRRDTRFLRPTAFYHLYLISPLSIKDAKHWCMLEFMVNFLVVEIAEDIYPAAVAELGYAFQAYEKGMTIKVSGFNEKLPILLNLTAEHLVKLASQLTEDKFNAIKAKLQRNIYNRLLRPGAVAKDFRMALLVKNHYNPLEKYFGIMQVTFEDEKRYIEEYFKTLYVKGLVQGNVDPKTAIQTLTDFVKKLNYSELKKEDLPVYELVKLKTGEQFCRLKSFNKNNPNSVIANYYQSDLYTTDSNVQANLVRLIIEEPLFDILRTKEQLGYDVSFSIRDTFGILGFMVTVVSSASKGSMEFLDQRIEAFLEHTQKLLDELDDEAFEKYKYNLTKLKLCSDIELQEEVDRNWLEIISGTYLFDRRLREVAAIKKTDLKTIKEWWISHNAFGNREKFRKLSVQVVGPEEANIHDPKELPEGEELQIDFLGENNDYFIKSTAEYKQGVEVFQQKY